MVLERWSFARSMVEKMLNAVCVSKIFATQDAFSLEEYHLTECGVGCEMNMEMQTCTVVKCELNMEMYNLKSVDVAALICGRNSIMDDELYKTAVKTKPVGSAPRSWKL